MSLFPAYSNIGSNLPSAASKDPEIIEVPTNKASSSSWLVNESFKLPLPVVQEIKQSNKDVDGNVEADIEIFEENFGSDKYRNKVSKQKKRRRSSSPQDEPKSSKFKKIIQQEKIDSIFIKTDLLGGPAQKLYATDVKRDIENLQFGAIYKKQKATYKLKGSTCLGASEKQNRLLFEDSLSKKKADLFRRYFARKLRKIAADPIQILPLKSNIKLKLNYEDFLPLSSQIIINDEKLVFDPTIQMYRPVGDESSSISYDDTNWDEISLDNFELIRENKRFSRILTENPNNVDAWRKFLNFQDSFYVANARRDNVKLTKLALIDRKLAILDKALKLNSSAVELKLLRLDLGLEAGWDQEKLKEEWKTLEFNHINQPAVWVGRLKFAFGHFSNFTISRVAALFDRCCDKLSSVLRNQLITHPPLPHTEDFLVDCLVAKISFLLSGGHSEEAIALFQALVEFNFRQPVVVKRLPNLSERRRFFEPFWESNCPRFADDGAEGWSTVLELKQQNSVVKFEESLLNETCSNFEDEIFADVTKNEAQVWSDAERMRHCCQWAPWRRSTEDPEDSERVVLLDDVESSLFEIHEPHNRFLFFVKCLNLFGVEMPSMLGSSSDSPLLDFRGDVMFTTFENLPKVANYPFKQFDDFLFRAFDQADSCICAEAYEKLYLIYARILHVVSSIDAESNVSPKEKLKTYKKRCKEILAKSTYNNCAILYGAFAIGLKKLGSVVDAIAVLKTTLSSVKCDFSALNSLESLIALNLTVLLVKFALKNKNLTNDEFGEIANMLASFVFGGTDSNLAKANKAYSNLLSNSESQFGVGKNSLMVGWLGSSLGMLTFLDVTLAYVVGRRLNSVAERFDHLRSVLNGAKTVYDKSDIRFKVIDADIENSFVNEVFLVKFHLARFGAPPRLLREILERALADYPSNGKFLKLYVNMHVSGQLMIGLRRFFANARSNSVTFWTAAIYAEFSRYVKIKEQNEYCELHTLRHVFGNAVERCKGNAYLWRLYLKVEFEIGGESGAVRKLMYQALRQCPGSKLLYLDCVRMFPDECQRLVDLMTEKEIRVKLPWEELTLLLKACRPSTVEEKSNDSNSESSSGEDI